MKRIYSEVDNKTHERYKAYLEMNDMKMIDHIRMRVLKDVLEWEREHPEEVEYYRQLNEIKEKIKVLKG